MTCVSERYRSVYKPLALGLQRRKERLQSLPGVSVARLEHADVTVLAHRAGKHFKRVMAAAKPLQQEQLSSKPLTFGWRKKMTGPRRIVARGLARPEPDLQKLAQVVLSVAEQMAKDAENEAKVA